MCVCIYIYIYTLLTRKNYCIKTGISGPNFGGRSPGVGCTFEQQGMLRFKYGTYTVLPVPHILKHISSVRYNTVKNVCIPLCNRTRIYVVALHNSIPVFVLTRNSACRQMLSKGTIRKAVLESPEPSRE